MKCLAGLFFISFTLVSCSQYTVLSLTSDDLVKAKSVDTCITMSSLNNSKQLVLKYYKTNFKRKRIFAITNKKLQTKIDAIAVKYNLSETDKKNIIRYVQTMREKQRQANSQDKDFSLSLSF